MSDYFRRLLEGSSFAWAAHLVPVWGVWQAIAMLAAVGIMARSARGQSPAYLQVLALSFAGAGAGAAALGALYLVPRFVASGLDVQIFFENTIVAWGALLGLVGTFGAGCSYRRLPLWPSMDLLAPCLGPLVGFARVGCFMAGCDFGRVTGVRWAVKFPAGSVAFEQHLRQGLILASDSQSLAVHPTQLYEAAGGALMFGVAVWARRSRIRSGLTFLGVALAYALVRLVVEAYRGDQTRVLWGPLSASQWVSCAVILAVVVSGVRLTQQRDRPSVSSIS